MVSLERHLSWTRGTAPSEVAVLIGMADVQAECIYLEVLGWDRACERCWLVDYARIPRRVSDGLAGLQEHALREWAMVDLTTGEQKRVQGLSVLGVDSGFFTSEVYGFVRPRQGGRWGVGKDGKRTGKGPVVIATKGDALKPAAASAALPFRMSLPVKDPTAMRHGQTTAPADPTGIHLLTINTWYYKRKLIDTLRGETRIAEARAEAMKVRAEVAARRMPMGSPLPEGWDGKRLCFFPDDTEKWYFDQLTGEEEKTRMVAGRRVIEFLPRPGRGGAGGGNHMLDCRVGNMCLVEAMKVREEMARRRGSGQ